MSGETSKNTTALFHLQKNGMDKYMQVLFAGQKGRTFYAGEAPPSNTAPPVYRNSPTPAVVCRQQGEAWTRPFVAIYEPFEGAEHYSVRKIEMGSMPGDPDFTTLSVYCRDGSRQVILQSADYNKPKQTKTWKFEGAFGVINLVNDQPRYLYLGYGSEIKYGKYGVKMKQPGAMNLAIESNTLQISCNEDGEIIIPKGGQAAAMLTDGQVRKKLVMKKTVEGISFIVPPVKGGVIQFDIR